MRMLPVVVIGAVGLLASASGWSRAGDMEPGVDSTAFHAPRGTNSLSANSPSTASSSAASPSIASPSAAQPSPPRPLPATQATVHNERVERMLQNRLSCLGCHRIGDEGGAIGPTLNGIGARSDVARVLAMIRDPDGVVPGTLMPRQRLEEREAIRLAEYLVGRPDPVSVAPIEPVAAPILGAAEQTDGAALYARHCAACHGDSGNGDGWNAALLPVPPTAHTDASLMSKRPDDTLYDGIAAGAFVLDGSPRMPAFGELLSSDQIRALVRHIRVLCECTGPAWSRGMEG